MKARLMLARVLLPMPSIVKVQLYRLAGYRIGRGVRIGFSLLAADACEIGHDTRIGHFNILSHTKHLSLGRNVVIGHFNIILGGDLVSIGIGTMISRFNEINSILNPLATNSRDPRLIIGDGTLITASHKIDFSNHVEFGENVVFAGRNSNIWTHNRQQTRPVRIGRNCYVGANVQFAPGASVGDYCVVALGSVVTKPVEGDWKLVAGMPAKVVKDLDEESKAFVTFPTRPDLDGPGPLPVEG